MRTAHAVTWFSTVRCPQTGCAPESNQPWTKNEGEDARESARASIRIEATLRGPGLDQTLAFITNLSAGGAALYVGQEIPSSSIQTIEFSLPGEKENLTAVVELIWRDVQGRMGIRFANVSAGVSESVEKWSAAHSQAQAGEGRRHLIETIIFRRRRISR